MSQVELEHLVKVFIPTLSLLCYNLQILLFLSERPTHRKVFMKKGVMDATFCLSFNSFFYFLFFYLLFPAVSCILIP